MLGQQHRVAAGLEGQRGQRAVTLAPRPGLDAQAVLGLAIQASKQQRDRQAATRPALHLAAQSLRPVVGFGVQAMMDMQRDHLKALPRRQPSRAMQQRRRIAAAAGGHRHGRRKLSGPWSR